MPMTILPREIRARIFFFLDDITLAESIPEVFWAIAPHRFRSLRLGQNYCEPVRVQMRLVNKYPNCGNLVQHLTILSDIESTLTIRRFLKNFPRHNKLNHLTLSYSSSIGSPHFLADISYSSLLQNVLDKCNDLARLSFIDLVPCSLLINGAAQRLTRLDFIVDPIWYRDDEPEIPLTPNLEVLSIPPNAVRLLTGPPPDTLRTIIFHAFGSINLHLVEDVHDFLEGCSSVTSLAFVDHIPERCGLFSILHNLPQIDNVCFKFTYPSTNTVNQAAVELAHFKVSVKVCTFLLAISSFTVAGMPLRPLLQGQARSIAEQVGFEGVLLRCVDGESFQHGTIAGNKLAWSGILDISTTNT